MTEKTLSEKIREKLLIEAEITDETLDKASRLIGITKDGKIVFKIDRGRIPISDQILLYLIGKKLAYEAKLASTDACTLSELAKELGLTEKVVGARLSEHVRESIVERLEAGVYRISLLAINPTLDKVEGLLSKE